MATSPLREDRNRRQQEDERRNGNAATHKQSIRPKNDGKRKSCNPKKPTSDFTRQTSAKIGCSGPWSDVRGLRSLVLVPRPMLMLAELAISRRQRVIHSVLYRGHRLHVGIHRFHVIVRHTGEFAIGHDRI